MNDQDGRSFADHLHPELGPRSQRDHSLLRLQLEPIPIPTLRFPKSMFVHGCPPLDPEPLATVGRSRLPGQDAVQHVAHRRQLPPDVDRPAVLWCERSSCAVIPVVRTGSAGRGEILTPLRGNGGLGRDLDADAGQRTSAESGGVTAGVTGSDVNRGAPRSSERALHERSHFLLIQLSDSARWRSWADRCTLESCHRLPGARRRHRRMGVGVSRLVPTPGGRPVRAGTRTVGGCLVPHR